MDTWAPVEKGRFCKGKRPFSAVTRQEDQTVSIRTQQCVLAIVDFGMLAIDVPHVLVLDRERMLRNPMLLTPPTRIGAPCNGG